MLLFCLAVAPAAAASSSLDEADALLKAGKAAEAYKVLEPLEPEHSGDPKFDYLLGIAALDSGKPDKATLVFERVLAVDPNFAGARLDMARAYFQLGDLPRAKSEFQTVLQQNPPDGARVTIERYLAAIDERQQAKKTHISGFVEGTIGYDTNVNSSTAEARVAVPALGNLIFTLDPTNVKRKDEYAVITAGVDIAHEVTPSFALFGAGITRYRAHDSEDTFDYKSLEGRGGFVVGKPDLLFRATFSREKFWLDHDPNRTTHALSGDLRVMLRASDFLNFFAQQNRYRFESQAIATNDFDLRLGGIGWLHLFGDGRSLLNVSLYVGEEAERNLRADGNKDIFGARLGAVVALRDDVDAFGSFGWQSGRYRRENIAFMTTRTDTQMDGTLGLVWRFAKSFSLRPQITLVRNDSNVAIHDYGRTDYSVSLRWEFR